MLMCRYAHGCTNICMCTYAHTRADCGFNTAARASKSLELPGRRIHTNARRYTQFLVPNTD